ncbi:hypothetical protein LX16_4633 [Stackebrandtia albiflava]|uniref:Uncharacterized protein n=1 Tax=Stackebrandtia albiflava TaxID=406432 RepID=A0A562UQF0_9ACTN|nr:hypothetical protein [Stackebrandtia albiflava]TWJ07852.1 hypothetical protein LX16_4633 [Stackebrandtia albiflava]
MTLQMEAVLAELPDDLRPVATRLWRRAGDVTDEVTETLMYAYKVLGEVPGRPESLEAGAGILETGVAVELADVIADLESAHPDVSQSWQGGGSEAFTRYMPRLTEAVSHLHQAVLDTAAAVKAFNVSMTLLWERLLRRVDRSADEVTFAVSAAGPDRVQAAISVIGIVEEFAEYVDQLAESLVALRADSHQAGSLLVSAAEPAPGLTATANGLRLPSPSEDMAEEWHPTHSQVWLDTRAMASLTAALSDSADCWRAAADSGMTAAREHFTVSAFGLAGVDFQPRVRDMLDRDVETYRGADRQLTELADTLRQIGRVWVSADDAVAEELRRGLDDA